MRQKIGRETKRDLLQALRNRYGVSSKKEKVRIQDEFTAVSGYHRKYATRLLNMRPNRDREEEGGRAECRIGQRIYDEAVREALIVV
jgi:hypothetical protein